MTFGKEVYTNIYNSSISIPFIAIKSLWQETGNILFIAVAAVMSWS
jgi:hypothetical protein